MSRGRIGILTSARFASSFLTLESDGALGLRVLARIVLLSRLRCPEVGLGFPSRRSSDGRSRSDLWTPKYRGRCSVAVVVSSACVYEMFLVYLNGWAGKARGRVGSGY